MGCCGQERASARTGKALTSKASPSQAEAIPNTVGGARNSSAFPPNGTAVFELRGPKPLIVVGGVTASRYYFREPGMRLSVDVRDAESLLMVQQVIAVDRS